MYKEENVRQEDKKPMEAFKIALVVLVLVLLILIAFAVVTVTSTNHPGAL